MNKDKVHDKETHGTSSDITNKTSLDKVKAPNLFERAKEEVEALVGAVHDKMEHDSSPHGNNGAIAAKQAARTSSGRRHVLCSSAPHSSLLRRTAPSAVPGAWDEMAPLSMSTPPAGPMREMEGAAVVGIGAGRRGRECERPLSLTGEGTYNRQSILAYELKLLQIQPSTRSPSLLDRSQSVHWPTCIAQDRTSIGINPKQTT